MKNVFILENQVMRRKRQRKTVCTYQQKRTRAITTHRLVKENRREHKKMNENYYKNMPEDIKKAVAVIKDYCQNEECAADCECDECPYPLSVIRCGDVER